MANKSQQKINNADEWSQFAISYLVLVELACNEMLEKKYDVANFNKDYLYIPAIFNLKHGIEIFLKTIGIKFLEKTSLDNSDFSHDIDNIFDNLKRDLNIKKKDLKEAARKYNETISDSNQHIDGSEFFITLGALINKYQQLTFLKDKIDMNFTLKDLDNTAFKYPTNSLTMQIDYKKILGNVESHHIWNLKSDTHKLQALFWEFEILMLPSIKN